MIAPTTREQLQVVAARLLSACQFQQMYPPRHPRVDRSVADCYAELQRQLQLSPTLQIALAEDEFVLGNIQVPVAGEVLGGLAVMLASAGIERLEFRQGLRRWELQRFLRLLGRDEPDLEAAGGIEELLEEAGVTHIRAGRIGIRRGHGSSPERLFRVWEAYGLGLAIVGAVRQRARRGGKVDDVGEIRDYARNLVDLALQESRPLLAMQTLKQHDEYSFTHSVNVAILTVALASSLPFDNDQLHDIGVAALLHDIGKERIPLEILGKPDRLSDEEWEIVNRHGREGARMLADAEGAGDLAPIVAYEHHVAYHEELRDDPEWVPHLVSRLVTLADYYDALRSERPYRGEVPPDVALETMDENIGRLFDPDLFEGFRHMVGYYPPGTCVRLSSGRVGVVRAANGGSPREPVVLILRNRDDTWLVPPEQVDLSTVSDLSVAGVVDPEGSGIDPLSYL